MKRITEIEAAKKDLFKAIQANEEGSGEAFYNFMDLIAKEAAEKVINDASDKEILAARGENILTKGEQAFYNKIIEGDYGEKEELMFEQTTITRVFDDVTKAHPLLSKVKATLVKGDTKWVFSKPNAVATWQNLATAIKDFADADFSDKTMGLFSLSIGMYLHESVLLLGATWLDKYVRTILEEAMTVALELAIVDGNGVSSKEPCGMMRLCDVPSVANKQPYSIARDIDELDIKTFLHTKGQLNKNRNYKVPKGVLTMIVNPDTYAGVILEKLIIRNDAGQYVTNTPIAVEFIESFAVPFGKVVCGYLEDYELVVGRPSSIISDKSYKFMENEVAFKTILYANGRPLHDNRFIVLNFKDVVNPFEEEGQVV